MSSGDLRFLLLRPICLLALALSVAVLALGCGSDSATSSHTSAAGDVGAVASGDAARAVDSGSTTAADTAADTETNTDDATSAPDSGTAAPPAPPIEEALVDACKKNAKHGTGVGPGTELVRISLAAHPDALCNDGTPAIMYVRGASELKYQDQWLFHLQGGGSCMSYEECRDRWCSQGTYQRSKMTSSLAPDAMKASGIFKRTMPNGGPNPAAAGNEVWVYYCSSDLHRGQKNDVEFVDPTDPSKRFSMHRRGHSIVEAVVAELKDGVTAGTESLPPLKEAKLVFFTGTSAGSAGAQKHLDWFASTLGAQTQVVGLFDAAFPFDRQLIDNDALKDLIASAATPEAWAERQAFEDEFFDASCLAAHVEDPWRCADPSHVAKHHITTPFFVRHDLLDPPTVKAIKDYEDALTVADWTHQTLVGLADLASAEEASAMTRTPGVFSQACSQHVGITNDQYTFVASLEDSTGTPRTFMDAFVAWFGGMDVALIQTVNTPHIGQTCPPTNASVD